MIRNNSPENFIFWNWFWDTWFFFVISHGRSGFTVTWTDVSVYFFKVPTRVHCKKKPRNNQPLYFLNFSINSWRVYNSKGIWRIFKSLLFNVSIRRDYYSTQKSTLFYVFIRAVYYSEHKDSLFYGVLILIVVQHLMRWIEQDYLV
jgi:hypothetical protein